MTINPNSNAEQLAELTFNLLEDCHQKEKRLAIRYGLTTSEFHCLRVLNVDEVINNKDLAARLNLSAGRLTRIINGLVKKGYTHRKIAPQDRRNMHVSLSEKGKRMVEELNNAYVRIHQEILVNIDTTHHDNLIYGMTELLLALRKWMNK